LTLDREEDLGNTARGERPAHWQLLDMRRRRMRCSAGSRREDYHGRIARPAPLPRPPWPRNPTIGADVLRGGSPFSSRLTENPGRRFPLWGPTGLWYTIHAVLRFGDSAEACPGPAVDDTGAGPSRRRPWRTA